MTCWLYWKVHSWRTKLSCRWLSATWHPLHLTCTSPQSERLTSRSWPLLQRSLWGTWTKSSTSTITQWKRWSAVYCVLAILHYCNCCGVWSSLSIDRQRTPTSATGPSALVFRVWPTPSFSCASPSRAQRLNSSTHRSLRPSTTLPWSPAVSWLRNLDRMKPTLGLLWARA